MASLHFLPLASPCFHFAFEILHYDKASVAVLAATAAAVVTDAAAAAEQQSTVTCEGNSLEWGGLCGRKAGEEQPKNERKRENQEEMTAAAA